MKKGGEAIVNPTPQTYVFTRETIKTFNNERDIPGLIARRYVRKGRDLVNRCESELSKAMVAHEIGMCFFSAAQFDQAELHLKASLSELERAQHYNLVLSYHWLRHVHSVRGNTDGIIHWAEQELRYAEKTADNVNIGYALYGLADGLSRRGEFNKAITYARDASTRLMKSGVFTVAVSEQELGRAQLQASEFESAAQTLQRNANFIWRNLLFLEFCSDTYALRVEAMLGFNWSDGPTEMTKSKRREVLVSARRARLFCLRFPTLRPHCYRVSGRAATANGKAKKALQYFDKAIASADKIGARYELARALIDKSVLDHSRAQADRQRGFELLEELGCVLPKAEREYLKLF